MPQGNNARQRLFSQMAEKAHLQKAVLIMLRCKANQRDKPTVFCHVAITRMFMRIAWQIVVISWIFNWIMPVDYQCGGTELSCCYCCRYHARRDCEDIVGKITGLRGVANPFILVWLIAEACSHVSVVSYLAGYALAIGTEWHCECIEFGCCERQPDTYTKFVVWVSCSIALHDNGFCAIQWEVQ